MFKVIEGKNTPKRYRGRAKGDIEPIICPVCQSSWFITLESSVYRKKGFLGWLRKTYKSLACAECFIRNKITIVAHE